MMLIRENQFKICRAAVFLRACIASQVSLQLQLLPWCCHSNRQVRTFHHVAALVYLFLISVEHRALYDIVSFIMGDVQVELLLLGKQQMSRPSLQSITIVIASQSPSVTLPINPISSAETKEGHSFLV